MKPIFFDTEFTGLKSECELISLGFVDGRNNKALFEITDYDISKCDDWVIENVVNKTYVAQNYEAAKECSDNEELAFKRMGFYYKCGTKNEIAIAVKDWLYDISGEDGIVLVSDVCPYDYVLFCDLFGGSYYLPKWICPAPYDICQLIALDDEDRMDYAFDVNREELRANLCDRFNINPSESAGMSEAKHNALWDAIVIRDIFQLYKLGETAREKNNG